MPVPEEGASLMKPMIPITRPWVDEVEMARVEEVLKSGWLTQGPRVAEFETRFAEAVGASHACAVSSCTTALHLALLTAGAEPGDEVITVSHSYIATANSIRYAGAVPVFVDIDPGTFNMNPVLLEQALSPATKAVLCVHQMGMPCDLPAILSFSRRHNLPLIEDAACAIGSEINREGKWEKIGRPHGDMACFSFHPRKVITTGDGGMVTTSRADWAARIRLLRQHGMNVPDRRRHDSASVVFESYDQLGFNYRMTDIQAAVGLGQLERLAEIVSKRREWARRYSEILAVEVPEAVLPPEPEWARSNWQSYCVRLPQGIDQRTVMQAMLDEGVQTRRGIMCAHLEGAYAERGKPANPVWRAAGSLAESEKAQAASILLPLFPQMTAGEQDRVVRAFKKACSECTRR